MGQMRVNMLKLNSEKRKKVLWDSRKAGEGLETSPVLDGVIFSLKSQSPSLGTLFDTVVTLENPVAEIVWGAFAKL